MQTQEIHALVRRVQAGDKAAAAEILSLFRPLICKAAGQSHLREVREDAEQEAALALLDAVGAFDESRGVPFSGFAKAIVLGRVRTFFLRERRRWRREVLPADTRDEDGGAEDFFAGVADERDEIGWFEESESFRAALSALPEREQKILSLYYEKGLPLRAVGAKLGMSEKHVSVVKARAMKKMRQALGIERTRRRRKRPIVSHNDSGAQKGLDFCAEL